jgi:hypothetical protein
MSVAGYLASGKNAGLPSERLRARLKEDAVRAMEPVRPDVKPKPAYLSVEDYDPVLRAHCRLGEGG